MQKTLTTKPSLEYMAGNGSVDIDPPIIKLKNMVNQHLRRSYILTILYIDFHFHTQLGLIIQKKDKCTWIIGHTISTL